MTNKERSKKDGYSPLIFMAGMFEIIAVVLFLVVIFEWSRGPLENEVAAFELIGLLVLFAWLIRRIEKPVQIVGDNLDKLLNAFLRSLTNAAPAGTAIYRPIEIKDLCRRHRYSWIIALGLFIAVALPALVIFAMYSLAEGSPVTATVWKWTYLCGISLMVICLIWMIGTLLHARRWGCAKSGSEGSKCGE